MWKTRLTFLLTPWSRVLPEKLTDSQLVKEFPAFLKPKESLPHIQVPATCSCLEHSLLILIGYIANLLCYWWDSPGIDPRWWNWGFFPWFPPTKPCALRSTQSLKMSTRDFSWGKGGRCVWLTTYHPCSAESRDDPGP